MSIASGCSASEETKEVARTAGATSTATIITTTTSAPDSVSLLEAIESGQVQATFEATGGAGGAVVEMTVQLTSAESLTVVLPPGLVLGSATDGDQDLAVLGLAENPDDSIALVDDAPQEFVLIAFCLHPARRAPQEGEKLSIMGIADPRVVAVLSAASDILRDEGSPLAVQAAVYRVTDGLTIEQFNRIGLRDPLEVTPTALGPVEIRLARAILARAAEIDDRFRPAVAIAVDTTATPFGEPDVVRALGLAVDPSTLERVGYRGVAIVPGGARRLGSAEIAELFLPKWTFGQNTPVPQYDVREATRIIAAWEDEHGQIELTLLVPELENPREVNDAMRVVADGWERVGLTVEFISVLIDPDPARMGEIERTIIDRSADPTLAFATILVAPPSFALLPDE